MTLETVHACCDLTPCSWEEAVDVSEDRGAFYLKCPVVHEEGIFLRSLDLCS